MLFLDEIPVDVDRSIRCIVGQLIPGADRHVHVVRVAARARVGDGGGDGVTGSSHAVVAARVGDPNLPAAGRAWRLALLEGVAESDDEVGIRVGLSTGADPALLQVDGAEAGVSAFRKTICDGHRGRSRGCQTCCQRDHRNDGVSKHVEDNDNDGEGLEASFLLERVKE